MTRARETSEIIEKNLVNVPVQEDSLLVEGAPIRPEPPIHWKSEKHVSKIQSLCLCIIVYQKSFKNSRNT